MEYLIGAIALAFIVFMAFWDKKRMDAMPEAEREEFLREMQTW